MELMSEIEREKFRIVHEGGTHEVLCDGTEHIWRDGGKYNPPENARFIWRRGSCDCAYWRHLEIPSIRA